MGLSFKKKRHQRFSFMRQCQKKQLNAGSSVRNANEGKAQLVFDECFNKALKDIPEKSIDVHTCNSLMCIACHHPEKFVKFIKVSERASNGTTIKPKNVQSWQPSQPNQQTDQRNCEVVSKAPSQASTAPSSPSNSQTTLVPTGANIKPQSILFENISSVGIIRAYSSSNQKQLMQEEEDLATPYPMTRSRSLSDDESLALFVEKIESAEWNDSDVDQLMFGNPWEPQVQSNNV